MLWIVDVVLVVSLVGYLVLGYRTGFVKSIGGIAGIVIGAIAALFAMPLIGGFVQSATWRVIATLAVAIALLVAGHAAGASLGEAVSRKFTRGPLRLVDRIFGAAVTTVAAALVLLLVSTSAAPLGAPFLSQVLSSSAVLRVIDGLAPDPVQALLARVRSVAVHDALPRVTEALGGITTAPVIPEVKTGSKALTAAARSVVRVSGNAYACGQNQSGSGFVVAPNRVMTNAHVVAGVTELVVEAPGGESVTGKIVYFDPIDDLAIVATKGLSAKSLELSPVLEIGDDAVVDGYPFGGPFTTGAAEVLAVGSERVDDIYSTSTNPRDVYTLAADVQQGNSGGPLLTKSGDVAGLVFAKSADTANIGFAMTTAELKDAAKDAPKLNKRADTGNCIGK